MKLYLLGQKNGICRESQMKLGHDCPPAEDTKSEKVFFLAFSLIFPLCNHLAYKFLPFTVIATTKPKDTNKREYTLYQPSGA